MPIDKAINQAPAGLDALDVENDEPALEIEIVDPEEVNIKGPGFELEVLKAEVEDDFDANLAEEIDDGALARTCLRLDRQHRERQSIPQGVGESVRRRH
jgi:hypothetical protein